MGHNKLWKILQEMEIPDHLTCLLRNLYAASYKQQLSALMQAEQVKYAASDRIAFLKENNWESRVRLIETLL